MVAQASSSICRQISAEWSKDLLAVSRESAYLRGVCGDDGEAYADAFEGGLSGGVSFAADGEGGGSPMPDECDIDVAPQNLLGRDYAAGNVTLDAMCNDQSIGLPVSIPKPAEARRSPPKPAEARQAARQAARRAHTCATPRIASARALGRSGVCLVSSHPIRCGTSATALPALLASPSRLPPLIRHRQSVLRLATRQLRRGTPTSRRLPPPFAPRTLTCCSVRRRARPCCLRCSIWRVTMRRWPTLSTRRRPPPRSGCVPSSTSGCRWQGPGRSQLAGLFLLISLELAAARQLSGGGLGMTDPERVAAAVLDHREQIARDWGSAGSPCLRVVADGAAGEPGGAAQDS